MARSPSNIVLMRILGLVVFLIVLGLANLVAVIWTEPIFLTVLNFFNSNLLLIVLMSIFFMVGEMLMALWFPFNLPAPLFNAVGAVMLTAFIFRALQLVDILVGDNIFGIVGALGILLYPIVFVVVLIVGYITIFLRLIPRKPKEKPVKPKKEKPKKKKPERSWEDVGEEFKMMLYDAFHEARSSMKRR